MACFYRTYLLACSAAAAMVAAFPAQAEEILNSAATPANAIDTVIAQVESEVSDTNVEITDFEMVDLLESEPEVSVEENTQVEAVTEPEAVENPLFDDVLPASEAAAPDESVSTSADTLFDEPEVSPTTIPTTEDPEIAQVTRPLYRGVTPFYVGVGGNIGIVDTDNSAVGDFGFNIFSKVSLGPRFSVRPVATFSEDDFNITLPLTFNFNPVTVGPFSVYPYAGGGVDFGDEVGFLVNGGLDVPISRDFTLNSQVNWRVSEDTGVGLSLGIGYNFPVFFE